MARCCAYIFSDAGVCRTPREKPHDRTPTNRLTDARTKSRSLASAAAPASASMAARCAIQILRTGPGLAISGRRGNGSAGVSIHVQHPTNSEVKVSISGCAMRILEKNRSEAVFPEMCVLNGVGPNWNGVIFGGSILWSQSVPRAVNPPTSKYFEVVSYSTTIALTDAPWSYMVMNCPDHRRNDVTRNALPASRKRNGVQA